MSNFWNRLDDVMSRLPDEEEDIGDLGTPQTLYKGGGGSGVRPVPTNPPNVNAFFDANYDRISQLAKDMNVPPKFLLGLSAGESFWNRPQGQNNLFGVSVNEKPVDYASPDAAIDAFRRSQWFTRLRNKSTPDDFVNELVDTSNGKKKYNSKRPGGYGPWIHDMISTIDRRLPIWQQGQSPSP